MIPVADLLALRIVFRTRIKICGITRPADAALAAQAGADTIGMVFYPPARRNVSLPTARQIVAAIPPFVTPVALFVDASIQHIREIAAELNLSHIQLHGSETPEFVAQLDGFCVIKAIRTDRAQLATELDRWRQAQLPQLRGITLETANTQQAGGTGVANDWTFIESAHRDGLFDGLPCLILAGGLTPQTVGDVVRRIRPYAVDVSSGVEDLPGQKSKTRIEAFIRAVREADAS